MTIVSLRSLSRTLPGASLAAAVSRFNGRHPWSHNDHFHGWIRANLPQQRRSALDVGCGRGELVARLAPHFEAVQGCDVDETMRQAAARRCRGLPQVTIVDGDWEDAPGSFDLVTMVAVLHHLDVPTALAQVRRLLAPGGRFLVVGLAPPTNATDHAWDLASMVTNPIIGFLKHPRSLPIGEQRPSYPVSDPTLSYEELRDLVRQELPGATMRHRLGFRHTIAWTKPDQPPGLGSPS